jgi:hypothetical protein
MRLGEDLLIDRTSPTPANTPLKILTCPYCQEPIVEDLERGMLFWWLSGPATDRASVVERVEVAHKGCVRKTRNEWSCELWWFADPAQALRRLTSMADGHPFTGAQMQQLVDVAWAASMVATKAQRKEVVEVYVRTGIF